MLCKCGQPAEIRTTKCPDCRRKYQAEYMRNQRTNPSPYDPSNFAGKRAELQRLAREAGLVR